MSIKVFACGDLVSCFGMKDFVDDELKIIIQKCDLSICNFEASVYLSSMKKIAKAGPHIHQSEMIVQYLKYIGFNFVSLANNHIYDYGQEALENTINELHKYNIDYVGAGLDFETAYSTKIIEQNGIKIGLLAAAENEFGCLYEEKSRGGYAWIFHPLIEDNIRQLKLEVDAVVLNAHAGVENIEFPIKEWSDRYKRLCDIGVDVIIGHHPHVPQGYEMYKKSLIFYSLGNFYFDAGGGRKADDSYSVVLEFETDGLKDYKIIYHKKINGQTCKVSQSEVSFSLDKLNSLLTCQYEERNNEVSLKLFNEYYYGYYETAVGALPEKFSIIQLIKFLIKTLFFKNRVNRVISNKNLLLLHNIRIDTHRFVVQRALSLLSENKL